MRKKMSVTLLAATFALGMALTAAPVLAQPDVNVSDNPVAASAMGSDAASANDTSAALTDSVNADDGGQLAGDNAVKADDGGINADGNVAKAEQGGINADGNVNKAEQGGINADGDVAKDGGINSDGGNVNKAEDGGQIAGSNATKVDTNISAEEGGQLAGKDATKVEAEQGGQAAAGDVNNTETSAEEGGIAAGGNASEDNSLHITSMAVNASVLDAAVSDNTLSTGGAPVTTGNNRINSAFGGASGVTQVGQQSGINSLQEQNINVQANMSLGQGNP